jgi:hypothetical protein
MISPVSSRLILNRLAWDKLRPNFPKLTSTYSPIQTSSVKQRERKTSVDIRDVLD